MKLFGKKAGDLKVHFEEYVNEMRGCIKWFEDFFYAYSKGICGQDLEGLEREVRHAESKCDDKRREIQKLLTTGAFMPDFRSDIFKLIERADKVPNKAEDLVVFVSIACIPIPIEFTELFRELLDKTVDCAKDLADSFELVLVDLDKALEKAKQVEDIESEIDKLERRLYRNIFHHMDPDLTPGKKLLLKRFVEGIATISDKAEDASDHIELMAIKRKA